MSRYTFCKRARGTYTITLRYQRIRVSCACIGRPRNCRFRSIPRDSFVIGSAMLVRSRMTANVLTVTPTTTLGEALRITREQGIRHLPVVDNGKLVGLLSDRDLRLAAPPAWASDTDYAQLRATFVEKKISDVMTAHTIISTTEI